MLNFEEDGAQRSDLAAVACLGTIEQALNCLSVESAGTRLFGVDALRPALSREGPVGHIAALLIGPSSQPVRAILFNKTPEANWPLGWHQDRTIAVVRRVDVPCFGPWSIKSGVHHVAPPFEILARMVTLRVHLDPVSLTNAPLLIAPGSHRFGVVPTSNIAAAVEECGTIPCIAKRGDIWAYSTSILHASNAAMPPTRRRVLQIDYSPDELSGGLEWLGV